MNNLNEPSDERNGLSPYPADDLLALAAPSISRGLHGAKNPKQAAQAAGRHAGLASVRAPALKAVARLAVGAALCAALAACGGGGGGGGAPASGSAQNGSGSGSSSGGSSGGASGGSAAGSQSCAKAQAATATAAAQQAPDAGAPVDRLIVKLAGASSAAAAKRAQAAGSSASGSSSGAASIDSDTGARVQALVGRVMGSWNAANGQARLHAAASAAPTPTAERETSGGEVVLALGRKMPLADAEALAKAFAADSDVAYAEPDRRLSIAGNGVSAAPTDPDWSQQWNYSDPSVGLDMLKAWATTTGSASVVVADLDTGYRPHADFAANLLPGYDFITDVNTGNNGHGRSSDATDPGDWVTAAELADASGPFYQCQADASNSSWHGTVVSGLIGAIGNNGVGIAGGSWAGKILPVRVMGKCGGTTSDLIDAIRWSAGVAVAGAPANPNPARIINMSLSSPGACSAAMQSAINDATAAGALVVVAGGNNASASGGWEPANCSGVIAVGATDQTGARASFSNYGSTIALSAPGANVVSDWNSGTTTPGSDAYGISNGTSFAAPEVAATAALMLAANPSLSNAQINQLLLSSARPSTVAGSAQSASGSSASCQQSAPSSTAAPGAGLLDSGAAVAAAAAQ
jgi:serine protease